MQASKLKKVISNIEAAGIDRFTIYYNNSYIIEVNSESTKCIFDDANEMLWYFRVPNSVQPKDPRPLALECLEYDIIERVCVPSDYTHIMKYAELSGLTLTDEITEWVKKAASQSGLYPVQTLLKDAEGKSVRPTPTIPSIIC